MHALVMIASLNPENPCKGLALSPIFFYTAFQALPVITEVLRFMAWSFKDLVYDRNMYFLIVVSIKYEQSVYPVWKTSGVVIVSSLSCHRKPAMP